MAQQFEATIRALLQPDNRIRAQAEKALGDMRAQNPTAVMCSQLELATTCSEQAVQHISYVLLRRLLKTESLDKLDPEAKMAVREKLLSNLGKQTVGILRKSHAYCLVAFAIPYLDKLAQWPQLCPCLEELVRSGNPDQQESALLVLAQCSGHYPEGFLDSAAPSLKSTFATVLAENQPPKVRIAATAAITETLVYLENTNAIDSFVSLLPQMTQAIGAAVSSGDADNALRGIEAFITISAVQPRLFRKNMKDILAPFLQMGGQENIDERLRRAGLEFTITCAENDAKTVRKVQGFLNSIVPLAMKMMTCVDEDSSWATTAMEDDDEEMDSEIGQAALDRLSMALGGKTMSGVALPLIQQALGSDNWKQKMVGILALANVAEGCVKELTPFLQQIVPGLVQHVEHPHPRVRGSALSCIAQFCSDFGATFTETHHSTVIGKVVQAVADDVPKVSSIAIRAIRDYLNNSDEEVYEPYLDAIMTSLLTKLQNTQHRFVVEDIVLSISTVASVGNERFEKYYATVMPWLKQAASKQVTARSERVLRAAVVGCLSRVVQAVGKERFSADGNEVLQIFRTLQQMQLPVDDPLVQELPKAWGRMAEVLKSDFTPFIPMVVPPLLEILKNKTEVEIGNGEEEENSEEKEGVESFTLNLKGVGDARISIKTAAVEEKADATNTLRCIVSALEGDMISVFEQLLPLCVTLLKYPYHDSIRDDTAAMIGIILRIIAEKVPAKWQEAVVGLGLTKALLDAVVVENNPEALDSQLTAIASIIRSGTSAKTQLPTETLQAISDTCKRKISMCFADRSKLQKMCSNDENDDDDSDEIADQVEEQEEALHQIVEVLTALLETKNCAFVEHFEKTYFDAFAQYLNPANDRIGDFERRLGVCMLTAYIEARGDSAHNPTLVQAFVNFCNPNYEGDVDLIQAAAYGLGKAAECCTKVFLNNAMEALSRLCTVVTQKKSDEDWESAVCNAVWALQQAHQYGSGPCHDASVMNTVLSALPVKGDEEQAQIVHERLIQLVEQGNTGVLGPSNSNLAGIANVAKQLMEKRNAGLVNDPTKQKLQQFLASVA